MLSLTFYSKGYLYTSWNVRSIRRKTVLKFVVFHVDKPRNTCKIFSYDFYVQLNINNRWIWIIQIISNRVMNRFIVEKRLKVISLITTNQLRRYNNLKEKVFLCHCGRSFFKNDFYENIIRNNNRLIWVHKFSSLNLTPS